MCFQKAERSKIMQRVKSSGNKSTEEKLIQYFTERHITEWRQHYNVKGHPDFVFLDKHIAIFVDGCFWYGHDCRNMRPSDNADFWNRKRGKTRSMMQPLHSLLWIAVGLSYVYGNANSKRKTEMFLTRN